MGLKRRRQGRIKRNTRKKSLWKRSKEDVHQGGIVGTDFGTKSTVVVYQRDKTTIMCLWESVEEY